LIYKIEYIKCPYFVGENPIENGTDKELKVVELLEQCFIWKKCMGNTKIIGIRVAK
jgi:hypothetical protein